MKYASVWGVMLLVPLNASEAAEDAAAKPSSYSRRVRDCLVTLMELDSVLQRSEGVLESRTLTLDGDGGRIRMSMENW